MRVSASPPLSASPLHLRIPKIAVAHPSSLVRRCTVYVIFAEQIDYDHKEEQIHQSDKVFFPIPHLDVSKGDDANEVDSYEEDYYSGDAIYIDDARYEFLHNDSDDSGVVLVSQQQVNSTSGYMH
ncbi:hypothetical protein L1987_58871 [Smallanthus sonchifolius]|uniref:Uncharacterized protein n=1 Tax=Smallanthus sonchifolius TaxID=185202 RepID=A0ACB9D3N1_9ASTR|nr:hypothetical protein L1987_58871 [Smallanthus sonchifolius]